MEVGYSRLYSLGNFENENIECTDVVGPDETYETAYQRVRGIVEAQHVKTCTERAALQPSREQLWEVHNRLSRAEGNYREVLGSWRRAVKAYRQMSELLAHHGVKIPELEAYYLPPMPEPNEDEQLVSGDDNDEADEA